MPHRRSSSSLTCSIQDHLSPSTIPSVSSPVKTIIKPGTLKSSLSRSRPLFAERCHCLFFDLDGTILDSGSSAWCPSSLSVLSPTHPPYFSKGLAISSNLNQIFCELSITPPITREVHSFFFELLICDPNNFSDLCRSGVYLSARPSSKASLNF